MAIKYIIPLLIPLAVSCASLDSKTALHIEHWAEDSATNKKINKHDIKIRIGLIIRCYHQVNNYSGYSDVKPNRKGYDGNFLVVCKPFSYCPNIGY